VYIKRKKINVSSSNFIYMTEANELQP